VEITVRKEVKVNKGCPCSLTVHHARKAYWGVEEFKWYLQLACIFLSYGWMFVYSQNGPEALIGIKWSFWYILLCVRPLYGFLCLNLSALLQASQKVKLSLCFNWAPRHEGVLGEWRYSSTHSLTSALDGGEWSASRPGHFTPGKEPLVPIQWEAGWAPEPFWTRWWRKKIPNPCPESDNFISGHSDCNKVNSVIL
jgi:hypothetical protein